MHPTRLAVILLALPTIASLALVVDVNWWPALVLFDLVIIAVLVGDVLFGRPPLGNFELQYEAPRIWSHGREETVRYRLDHQASAHRLVTVTPDLPAAITVGDGHRERQVDLPGHHRVTFTIPLRADERGTHLLGGLHLAATSRLGLWRQQHLLGERRQIHVYPNLKQLGEYALLARTDRLALIGVRRQHRVGGDTEFERLRDHQSDDPLQRIDWKATARRDQLTVRDYQINQSQTIILMIDTGRMMVSRFDDGQGADGGSLLDLAIDAALMLAYVAINQGDRVGLVIYADGIQQAIPPKGGPGQLNRLIHAVHDLTPSLVESRHDQAFLHLPMLERKRSLAICFTHLIDDVNAELISRHLTHLARRHLPIAVLLRDRDIHRHLEQAPTTPAELHQAGAAALIANWRRAAIRSLDRAGALTVDTDPGDLTAAVISRYLEVKARHLL